MSSSSCDSSRLSAGDVLSRVSYMTVVEVGGGYVTVKNLRGTEWRIGSSIVDSECISADQESGEEQLVSRTELVKTMMAIDNHAFSVTFMKANGEKRTMRCYRLSTEEVFGRTKVAEILPDGTKQERLVDHRTVEELVLKGTKYAVKDGRSRSQPAAAAAAAAAPAPPAPDSLSWEDFLANDPKTADGEALVVSPSLYMKMPDLTSAWKAAGGVGRATKSVYEEAFSKFGLSMPKRESLAWPVGDGPVSSAVYVVGIGRAGMMPSQAPKRRRRR